MSSIFDEAFAYVIENEGAHSNDKADRGGETFWGLSTPARRRHRCSAHPNGIADEHFRGMAGKEWAKHVYKSDYFRPLEGIRDTRLAIKLFDIIVNFGDPIRLIQRAAGVDPDGVFGPKTEAALLRMPTDFALERLCSEAARRYVEIVRQDPVLREALERAGVKMADLQLSFLGGWITRAIRRPPVTVKGVA